MTALQIKLSKQDERMKLLEWLAKELLAEWGLSSKSWKFEWNKRKRAFGLCSKRKKTIFLSTYLLPTISDEKAENTIRHEIAHALDFEDRGMSDHSWKWKQWAIKVGADPTRCSDVDSEEVFEEINKATAKWVYTCPNGHERHRHRRSPKMLRVSCGVCSPGKFDPDFKFTEKRN